MNQAICSTALMVCIALLSCSHAEDESLSDIYFGPDLEESTSFLRSLEASGEERLEFVEVESNGYDFFKKTIDVHLLSKGLKRGFNEEEGVFVTTNMAESPHAACIQAFCFYLDWASLPEITTTSSQTDDFKKSTVSMANSLIGRIGPFDIEYESSKSSDTLEGASIDTLVSTSTYMDTIQFLFSQSGKSYACVDAYEEPGDPLTSGYFAKSQFIQTSNGLELKDIISTLAAHHSPTFTFVFFSSSHSNGSRERGDLYGVSLLIQH